MKTSSGRLGQYKILLTNKSIAKHLLEIKLFSKENLLVFIESHQQIIIKPVYGTKQIFVSNIAGIYHMKANNNMKQFKCIDNLFQHLNEIELTDKYYIIQPNHLHFSVFDYVLTFHRKGNTTSWRLQSLIENEKYSIAILSSFLIKIKAIRLANSVAKELGNYFVNCNTIVLKISYDRNGDIWIQDSFLHYQKSKWSQYHSLSQNKSLSPHIPKTEYLSMKSLKEFLEKYKEVIIKPCYGKEGNGIVQIHAIGNTFELYVGLKSIRKNSIQEVFHYIEENYLTTDEYIIQEKLALATIEGNPIDVRVITQKVNGFWCVTGELVKVAGSGFLITNASQKLLRFDEAMVQSNISHMDQKILQSKMSRVCLIAANQLESYYSGLKIIGFDIGITMQGDIWIIEGNYHPNLSMFNQSNTREVYVEILKAKRKNPYEDN